MSDPTEDEVPARGDGATPGPAHSAPPTRALPGSGEVHRHILVAIVLNRPGVLNRVASLMRARNFNIESLSVSHTDQPDISRMTVTLLGDDVAVEHTVEHELALIKVRATDSNRAEIVKVAELYRARLVDITDGSVIVEASGSEAEVDAIVALLRSYGIKELVRTGTAVMARGSASIEEALKR
jgi:acetolactate synthase I/III small subunit